LEPGVSSLFSAAEELRASDVDLQTDEELEDDFVELQRAMDMLKAERLRRLAVIDRRPTYEREGSSVASGMVRTVARPPSVI
jgi:hypothetical protein